MIKILVSLLLLTFLTHSTAAPQRTLQGLGGAAEAGEQCSDQAEPAVPDQRRDASEPADINGPVDEVALFPIWIEKYERIRVSSRP
jgi:hypothetical protein